MSLRCVQLLNRVEVRGGAGSGKTFLAMEQARRLSAKGQRVALVCYSHGLASYLERITANWPRRQQPDHPMRFLGGDGPAVTFVACACARDDAMDAGDDEVELLLEEGWRPEDLALLTTGSRHPEQTARQSEGYAAYWDSFWDAEQVFYGHVLGFKGLERRAVVLVVNEASAFERSRERLYVGLSRARDQLVVCGDPDLIRTVGGPDLAHRLQASAGTDHPRRTLAHPHRPSPA